MSNTGIYPALSGATAASHTMEIVANNLANSSTPSFHAQRLGFKEVLSKAQQQRSRAEHRFVQMGQARTDPTPGSLRHTGQPEDVLLSGPGYLAVRTPQGERYLRGGTLLRSGDGRLLTSSGSEVLGADGAPIRLPLAGALRFGQQGEIFVDNALQARLRLLEFPAGLELQHQGNGLYLAPAAASANAATQTQLMPEFLEQSNVSPLRAMTDVIITSRHYEALHRVIETFREIDDQAARDLATVT